MFSGHFCVGYDTITVERGGFFLGSPQFKDVQETGGDVQDLAKLIKTSAPCTDMAEAEYEPDGKCAYIMVKTSEYDPVYDLYFYCQDSAEEDKTPPTPGWWQGDLETPLTDKLALGRGAWFVIPNDTTYFPEASYTFSFAGGVSDVGTSVSVPLVNKGYTIAANAFPAGLTGSKITFSPGVPCTDMAEAEYEPDGNCVTIMVKTSQQDPVYDLYFYCQDSAEEDKTPPTPGWWQGDLETPWEAPIAAGQAFWVVVPDGLLPDDKQTITFSL